MQELLTNCVKYAQAKTVNISTKVEGHWYVVTVRDDGIGFDTAKLDQPAAREGFGLFSIRERLRYFGGSMSLDSKIGQGTIVTLSVPLEAK
ncbi:MAG: ATP-binding protein [bacterium]|nr:ATP-binding protein [bacterium]